MHTEISLKKARRMLWLFGVFKIPMIGFCRPRIESLNDHEICLSIPTNYFTRNHLGSMYFGALSVGADLAAGFHAFMLARNHGYQVSFVFKSFDARFLHRPYGRVYFRAQAGKAVLAMLQQSAHTGERLEHSVEVLAFETKESEEIEIARFALELSLKVKPGKDIGA